MNESEQQHANLDSGCIESPTTALNLRRPILGRFNLSMSGVRAPASQSASHENQNSTTTNLHSTPLITTSVAGRCCCFVSIAFGDNGAAVSQRQPPRLKLSQQAHCCCRCRRRGVPLSPNSRIDPYADWSSRPTGRRIIAASKLYGPRVKFQFNFRVHNYEQSICAKSAELSSNSGSSSSS